MRKERTESLYIDSESDIEKCLQKMGYTDIISMSVKKDYDDDGHYAKKVFVVSFCADKVGEDILKKFQTLCESLDHDGQDVMGELEYELAEDFDRDGIPVYTEKLYQMVSEELKKRGIL